ncbi:DNA repair protein [Auriscalpium vulgare]|uniref:DNA repair protein n=1 Tax=Auriscalpium vulgare TaxID=40419 RepID=A0ACB8RRZ4_9AGAM|nr:DNA repair protein [Auriscalpium vulgare]
MRRKRAKLQIQNTEMDGERDSDKSRLFQGLAIYINGWTEPSIQDLRKLIVDHGGVFQPYLDKKGIVTHIITCSLTPAKVQEFKHMKVVTPDWLLNSVEAGVLLPWKHFVFRPGGRAEATQGRIAQTSLHGFAGEHSRSSGSASNPYMSSERTPSALSQQSHRSPSPPRVSDGQPSFIPHSTDPISTHHAAKIPDYASRESNEQAARAMKDPAWRAAHTSVAPDFIEGFYRNSRLHHLSTWKTELRALVAEAQERAERGEVPESVSQTRRTVADPGVSMRGAELVLKSPLKGKGRDAGEKAKERVIMHVDFDAFFVSAGLVDRPQLRGKPVVVCHSQGAQGGASSTSEIASASYEARKFGIKNGMSLQQARKLCPEIVTMPYEFEKYKQLSLKFYTILMTHADDLQAVSVDEALIEVTSSVAQMKVIRLDDADDLDEEEDPARQLAETIRAQVKETTSCEVSIGIAHNIMLARLATRKAKPAGSYYLRPSMLPDLIPTLDIKDLHGFGWSTRDKAQDKLGATNLGVLAKKSKAVLCDALGKGTGETLYNAIRGVDERKLESDKPRKSVSCEINYGIRFENNEQAEAFLHQMAEEVTRRLNSVSMKGKSLTLKVMKRDPAAPMEPPKFLGHGRCLTYSKQSALAGLNGRATDDASAIGALSWKLLKSLEIPPQELRGLGVQIQKLEDGSAPVPEPGQARLPFRPVESPKKGEASTSKLKPDPPNVAPPAIQLEPPSPGNEVVMQHTEVRQDFDLPSFSQVDRSVFDALPADVRAELEAEYKRRSASPAIAALPPKKASSPAAATALRIKGFQSANLARMTRQLAPRSKPLAPPPKSRQFGRLGRSGPAVVRVTDVELKRLEIDPAVFRVLPVKVQFEQLAQARGALVRPSQRPTRATRPLKPPKRLGGRWAVKQGPHEFIPPPPPPQANFVPPPVLRQPAPTPGGATLKFWEGADIQRLLGEWVGSFREHPPHAQDLEHFAKYLVRCVETDVGVERAVPVMRWWAVLLRREWGFWEHAPEEEDDDEEEDEKVTSEAMGRAWWKAYRGVKTRMNEVARRRFGGSLSFR